MSMETNSSARAVYGAWRNINYREILFIHQPTKFKYKLIKFTDRKQGKANNVIQGIAKKMYRPGRTGISSHTNLCFCSATHENMCKYRSIIRGQPGIPDPHPFR